MIHSIIGLMNSGKTLYMTYLLFLDFLKGRTIYTNFPLCFPHYLINKDYLIDLAKKQPNTTNHSYGFDELWIWLDCRTSQQNRIGSYFFLQSSKGDTKIYLTAQDNTQNERRIRFNQHLISICERRILINKKLRKITSEKRILPVKYQNKLYIKVKTYSQKIIGFDRELLLKDTQYIHAKTIFKLYDTNIKIKNE